jgi:ubiquinone/menaquinone biosynthesis C-methylase UbiE
MSASVDATQFKFDNPAVPSRYDEILVPRLFRPWAELLLDKLRLVPGECVVDVAAGPGTVARLAAERVGRTGRVIATDISPPMLAVARSKPHPPGSASIDYVESGAAPLLVSESVADVACCQQGLQFFPDRLGALSEMRRVLKSTGRLGVAVWDGLPSCTLWLAYQRALAAGGLDELAQMLLAPFSWGRLDTLREALTSAGFANVAAETRSLPIVFEGGVDQAFDGLYAQPVGPAIASLPEASRSRLREALSKQLAPLMEDGTVRGVMASHLAIATVGAASTPALD